ncbi:MAG: PH domain-containing protein [Patescibacteria group bacterium]
MLENLPGRQPDEKVIMVIRKHPIVYIRIFLVFMVAAVVPLTIFLIIWSKTFPLSQGSTLSVIGFLGAGLYFLYSLALLVVSILNEEFDLFILTDHRLIDITQVSFLSRTVATTPLNQIQDATSSIQGILGTVLNYGTIDVQTAAGSASNFTIDTISDPANVARAILNQVDIRKEKDLKYRKDSYVTKQEV